MVATFMGIPAPLIATLILGTQWAPSSLPPRMSLPIAQSHMWPLSLMPPVVLSPIFGHDKAAIPMSSLEALAPVIRHSGPLPMALTPID